MSLEFNAYTEDITKLLIRRETQIAPTLVFTQLYASCLSEDLDAVRTRLSNCMADITVRCASRWLQLNANNTASIWFGSRVNIAKITGRELLHQNPSCRPPSCSTWLDHETARRQSSSTVLLYTIFVVYVISIGWLGRK